MQEYRVRHGGLMRCCLLSIEKAMEVAEKSPSEGDKLHCQYCEDNYGIIFKDGAWEWNRPNIYGK